MNWQEVYAHGLSYGEFLLRYGTEAHRARWQTAYERARLTDAQRALLGGFERQMHLLCLAGTWCGDCVREGAILQRIAEATRRIELCFLDRDEHPEVAQELAINGGLRIPMVVFLSEDFLECARYGERTLATYRKMAVERLGPGFTGGGVMASPGVMPGAGILPGAGVTASEAKPSAAEEDHVAVMGSGAKLPTPEDYYADVVQDWLDEIERVQLLLRLSPRLRAKHGD